MKIARNCAFILSLIFTMPVFSQTGNSDQNLPNSLISSEAMHVHFDKDIYLPGETIWFKAYLYNVNEISYSSTNFYVAIYDEGGKILQQKQYPIFEGSCNGDFEIPDTLESNRIQFRAFTKAMIVNDSSNVYEKILAVYNKVIDKDSITANKTISLQFFPEGGQIITELENYVAFKATYADGSPAMISGNILQVQRNILVDTLDSFSTDSTGLGKFVLLAMPYKNYTAIWKDESGLMRQTPLPVISRYGISFHAAVNKKELEYNIAKNRSSDSLSVLHLLAQMGNYQVYKADLVIPKEMELFAARFPIDSVPAGLMQLTLFDKYWTPLLQRLVFINAGSADQSPLLIVDTINTRPRGKNIIEVSLPDTMFTNLSASISDINFYSEPQRHSISQDIWFNGQLNGLHQNIDLLLRSGNDSAIDLITLAHEWKRYSWQKAIDKNTLKPAVLDNYISLAINYKEKNFALPKNEGLNLVIKNKSRGSQFYSLEPISQTAFKKTDLVFFDSVKVSYQMNKNKELAGFLTFSKDDTLAIPKTIPALQSEIRYSNIKSIAAYNDLDTFVATEHKKFNDVQTIKRVIVKSKYKGNPILARIDELDKFYTSGMFSGTVVGMQFNLIDDTIGVTANNNLLDYLLYKIGVVKKFGASFGVDEVVIGGGQSKLVRFPVVTFIDEVQIDPMDEAPVSLLVLSDVAYVKYKPGIIIGAGFQTSHGALYIYTKKGNEPGVTKGLPFVYVNGYNTQKEFAGPDYANKVLISDPDLRTTLYWNPNIIMDKTNNKVRIEYYNNDVSKKLLLTIEGVNEKGKLIHIEKVIE